MSAVEKLFVHIFDEKKRIIDQANRQCNLFEQHLLSKFLIQGIVPPPWLTNSVLPSLTSDPKDLNEDGLIFEAPYSRPQSTIPFSHGNLVATTDDAQPQGCSQSEFHALEKESDAGDELSNLPDCSVNNVERSSIIAPEMDSGDISPQTQMESRISHSYNDHALSMAKFQRSKSRQRALELRHSAKAAKSCSGDDDNDGVFYTNIQSCAIKEVKRSDCLTEKHDQSNCSDRITRSKRLAQELKSLNVVRNTTEERSICKSTKSPQPSVLQQSQGSEVPVVSSFRSPKDPDLCAVKSKDVKNKSQHLPDIEVAAERSSSSNTEIAMGSAEVAVVAACPNTKALTTCTTEGPLNQTNSSYLDGRDSVHTDSSSNKCLLPKSLLVESVVVEKALATQENVIVDASATDDIEDRSAANVARADTDFDVLVAKNNVCSASSPKVGMDVLVSGPPSDFVMSMKPKQLDFDDIEELTNSELSSTDLKMGEQDIPPEKVTSLVCQDKCSFSTDLLLLDRQEVVTRQDEHQLNTCESHLKEAELSTVQKGFCTNSSIERQEIPSGASSSANHSIPSQVAYEKSSGCSQKEIITFKFVSEIRYLENDECNSKILKNASSAADTGNISMTRQAPNSGICLHQNNNLSKGKGFDVENDAGFSTDMEHSCPQRKRKKIESQAVQSLSASPSLLEMPHESCNERLVGGNLNAKEDCREAVKNLCVSDSTTDEMQKTEGCHIKEGSSLEVRPDERFGLDERDRTVDTFLTFKSNEMGGSLVSCLTEQDLSYSHNCLKKQMVVENLAVFDIGSTKRFTKDKNMDSWNDERSHSRKRICPEGNAKLSDGSSVSQGIQNWDIIGMEETNPEIEGFVIQPVDSRPSTLGDHIELEKLNFPSDTIEYASILEHLGKSSFMHSPLCYSSTPDRLHKIPDLYQSLPNGLVEGMMMGTRSSLPLNDEIGKSLSDCQPYCKDQSTSGIKRTWASPIQTLWDRINYKFSSSGRRDSLKSELPCIDEENEAADGIPNTFQEGIGTRVMTTSIIREPLAEITDNSKPSSSVSQDSVAREFSLSGTHNQVKQKLEKDNAGRKFTGKGKEIQSISRGANHAKRNTGSVCNRINRPKLSGKISMKKGTNYSSGKSTCNNIVSNMTSFIPLVQQKQAAEVITGKRDIKVKALEAAEAAKRMAEKKENERKMRKEAAKRERLEQNNLRQQELENQKIEEERKKKEAEIAVKKRKKEEEERKEKERKRRRVDEAKRKQQEHEEKMCAKKEEKETKFRAAGEGKHKSKKSKDGREKCKNSENIGEGNMKISLDEHLTIKDSTNDKTKESLLKDYEGVNDCGNTAKVTGKTIKATEDDDLIVQNTIQEQSYDISPYNCSDDEEEEETDDVNNKFVPSWASKYRLSLAVSSQKLVDRETVFPMESFCSISKVLLPRKLPELNRGFRK